MYPKFSTYSDQATFARVLCENFTVMNQGLFKI